MLIVIIVCFVTATASEAQSPASEYQEFYTDDDDSNYNIVNQDLLTPDHAKPADDKNVSTPKAQKKTQKCKNSNKKPKRLEYSPSHKQNGTKKRGSQPTLNNKAKALLVIDLYAKTNFGIWINCFNENCQKWRWVPEYEEASEVPEIWTCSMNKNERENHCDIPEGNCTGIEFITDTDLVPGSIVWAKMPTYPSWPAMVDCDPNTEEYLQRNDKDKITHIHVTFMDVKPTRYWVKIEGIRRFTGFENLKKVPKKQKRFEKAINSAQKRCERALTMKLGERLKTYSFAVRYKGKWTKAEDNYNSESDEDSLVITLNETQSILEEMDSEFRNEDVEMNQDDSLVSSSFTTSYDKFHKNLSAENILTSTQKSEKNDNTEYPNNSKSKTKEKKKRNSLSKWTNDSSSKTAQKKLYNSIESHERPVKARKTKGKMNNIQQKANTTLENLSGKKTKDDAKEEIMDIISSETTSPSSTADATESPTPSLGEMIMEMSSENKSPILMKTLSEKPPSSRPIIVATKKDKGRTTSKKLTLLKKGQIKLTGVTLITSPSFTSKQSSTSLPVEAPKGKIEQKSPAVGSPAIDPRRRRMGISYVEVMA